MLSLLTILLACSPDPPAEPEPPEAVEVPAPAEPAPQPEPAAAAPAKGSIGGEPILPRPVVMGGIDARDVDAALAEKMADINRCYEVEREKHPELAGKVLVKFIIDGGGRVTRTTTRSTSLRHPPTESCVNDAVAEVAFPALTSGRMAIVHYPFTFPPG